MFFSINMCKKIWWKKMYLCLLLYSTHQEEACLSHCLLHEHSVLDDFEPPWTWMPLKKNPQFTMHFNFSSNVQILIMNQKILLQALCTIVCKEAHYISVFKNYFESVYIHSPRTQCSKIRKKSAIWGLSLWLSQRL